MQSPIPNPQSPILPLVRLACGLLALLGSQLLAATDAASADPGLPYVYTQWDHFTTSDGLPNDHIFAIKADHSRIWIGTENGLACYDKRTGKIRSWSEKDGLPWRVVAGIDVDPRTGEVWLALFGGGLARFSGGRFDHYHQLNSGLVNDVVYGVAVIGDEVWAATTAGASRFNIVKDKWDIYTEQNAPMEEIWNYGVSARDGKVFLAIWGSGVLEFDLATENWKHYIDPDGEMEIDLYRDDGIPHVITTGISYVDQIMWASTYFGACRYDGRHWRGFFTHEGGTPSDFNNAARGRSAHECWYCTDKGIGAIVDFHTDTWVVYQMDPDTHEGIAEIRRAGKLLKTVRSPRGIPHNYALWADFDGTDVWVGTSKGLGWGHGTGHYPRLKPRSADFNTADCEPNSER
jgi:ligand-binding sensor domain-containing protein